ncbi:cytochrome c maturation protein CcmE domain-containing protein [Herpetosiphon geysericola]|uniref:Cytochrome C biogenesis protein n=1 Tax=Herpetosiphon geysericola TaxID=70996 RepID=A0A0P6YHG3_9CHLR|nr:cytochrome c maturation protein CcmE [Herpetosiphon geysericola]KPL88911.1 hypothetical protein SE18_09615 [Herpetosiphon geysericola]
MSEATTPRFRLKPLHMVGIALLVLAGWLGFTSMGDSLTPYVNVSEAKASGRNVQVMGYPQNQGTVEAGAFRFTMRDEMGQPIEVLYRQPKPGNFDQAISVVAIGAFDESEDIFVADDLLVKCPSKYQEDTQAAK